MIPESRFAFVPNVACSNDTLCLGVSPSLGLGAAVWTTPRTDGIEMARHRSLLHAMERLLRAYPNLQIWLLAGHRVEQPDTRIARYLGLWKSLQRRGLDLPEGRAIDETCVTNENGVRFFGALAIRLRDLEKALKIVSNESGAIVAADELTSGRVAAEAIVHGWPVVSTKPPEEILELVHSAGGFVAYAYGEFDDPSTTAAVFGRPDSVKLLEPSTGSGAKPTESGC